MLSTYQIIISPKFAADLTAIFEFIQKQSPQNAVSVAGRIIEAVDGLERFPGRYAIYQGLKQISEPVRRMPVLSFLIYYRIDEHRKAVEVITIRHSKQKPPLDLD